MTTATMAPVRRTTRKPEPMIRNEYDVRNQANIARPQFQGQRIAFGGQFFATIDDLLESKTVTVCGCCGVAVGLSSSHHKCLFGREVWCAGCKGKMKPGEYAKINHQTLGMKPVPARETFTKEDSAVLADQIVAIVLGTTPVEFHKVPVSSDWRNTRNVSRTIIASGERPCHVLRWSNGWRCIPCDDQNAMFSRLRCESKTLRKPDGDRVMAAIGAIVR
jgi:hypothetical protein